MLESPALGHTQNRERTDRWRGTIRPAILPGQGKHRQRVRICLMASQISRGLNLRKNDAA
jgi:hypothetical protein